MDANAVMNRASLAARRRSTRFIYANDRSPPLGLLADRRRARFRAILARWIGLEQSGSLSRRSTICANDHRAADRLAEHYAVEERCRRRRTGCESDYPGARPSIGFSTDREIARASVDRSRRLRRPSALDTDRLLALREPSRTPVTFLPSRSPQPRGGRGGFRIGETGPWGRGVFRQQLVNATWERRSALDRQVGIAPPRDLLHRLKYRVIARLPADLPGLRRSRQLGRYGVS
jgi:hypothetical protein